MRRAPAGRVVASAARLLAAFFALWLTAAAAPDWAASVAGDYGGRIRNEGRMECQRTQFTLQNGALVGHYRIEADEPFEGELTNFVPDRDTGDATRSGRFTWTDRWGTGVEYVRFAADGASFAAEWGDDTPLPFNTGWGVRGGTAGCAAAVS
jgi:hypothetical protein